ncbi:hypothetical protein AVEN_87173-1 [Araneus ventricosus]|uniref:MADF domain-containing protein n=1 Tax=Araneus ventricosus TaxID=182803 RepID=A0A4Y2NJW4_ARAVE|nr:hypothetical protein AVEN_87173-1 [Araneus ventricosus]
MINSETLIALVHSNPELWDVGNMNYPNKSRRLKAWVCIAEKLGVTVEAAKSRWTNLRDLFRRELKKTLRMVKETGDPNAHEPRWRHFKSMLYLKDQMAKYETANCLQYDESLYPQTILGEP